jgi:hypothetical protein
MGGDARVELGGSQRVGNAGDLRLPCDCLCNRDGYRPQLGHGRQNSS